MTLDLAAAVLTLALALFLGSAIYHWLIDRWGDDDLEYTDVAPARSHVVLVRDEDGAA